MFSKATGETFTATTLVVLDVQANHIETVYEGQEPIEVIQRTMWVGRGCEFQLCEMTETREVIKFAPAGTHRLCSEAYRRVGEPTFKTLRTLKWTGKQFKEI